MGSSFSARTKRILTLGGLFLCIVTVAGLGAAMVTGLPGSGGGEGTISGTVYDSDGDPVESQTVRLSGDTLENEYQTVTSENRWFGIVGDPGAYEFAELEGGAYTVRVVGSDDEYEPQQAQPGEAGVDFEPVGSETEGNVNNGADGITETTSEESAQSDVSGTVNIVPDWNLPASTAVTLSDGEFTRTAAGNDDDSDDGADVDRFSGVTDFTDVPHGEYTVEVTADGHEPDSQAITVSENTEEFELDLIEHSSLKLTVMKSDSYQPLEDANIALTGEDEEEVESGTSGEDGQFTTDSLAPQLYTVSVSIEGYEDVTVETELEPGEDREVEEIALTPEST